MMQSIARQALCISQFVDVEMIHTYFTQLLQFVTLTTVVCVPAADTGCSVDEYGPEDSLDESLLYVTANRVGVFRRGKSKCKVVGPWAWETLL